MLRLPDADQKIAQWESFWLAALAKTPEWYARWAIRHAERWGLRRYNDPQLMADWWPLFRHSHVTEAELDDASLWLVTAEKPPKGRPDHPRMLLVRIKSQRQYHAAKSTQPAAEKEQIVPSIGLGKMYRQMHKPQR